MGHTTAILSGIFFLAWPGENSELFDEETYQFMPELPEVETVVRGLRGPLVGRTFTGVTVMWPNSIKTPIPELEHRLPGQRIKAISRRGKYLQFHLSDGETLFIHLKMSGDLRVEPAGDPIHHHVRTIFDLDNRHQLRFKDMRKFGRVYLVDDPEPRRWQTWPGAAGRRF